MTFTDIFIRRPVLATVISLMILVLGVRAVLSLPVLQYPRTENAIVTVTTAFSVRGNCRIGSVPTERTPSTRIIRLTTLASTGRRMKMSVKFMGPPGSIGLRGWARDRPRA